MTDKQIIDGVDVSGCSYGEIEKSIFKCSCEYNVCSASMFCKDNPNCYYKQLKRKEQECEKLKEEKQGLIKDWEEKKNLGYEIACKNEKLKQALKEIKEIAEECCYKCNSMNNCNISCKYYNDCNGEFSYLLAYLNKQICNEVNDDMENN